ncbi:hypothetical protein TDB9533_04805 [Thalassocella blandensis]|nr:hypothetical protein TDB9533_04805 [Thalassocella blandensis]
MQKIKLEAISDLFLRLGELDEAHALYLPTEDEWELQSKGSVIDPDEAEDSSGIFFKDKELQKLKYVMSIADLVGVYENLTEQTEDIDLALLFRAFLFYVDNNAYLDV